MEENDPYLEYVECCKKNRKKVESEIRNKKYKDVGLLEEKMNWLTGQNSKCALVTVLKGTAGLTKFNYETCVDQIEQQF